MSSGFAAFLFCWLAPGIISCFFGESIEMFGSVWLFRAVWIPLWPILVWFMPTSNH